MKTEVMVEANTSNSVNYASFPNDRGNDQFRLREAFVQAGNLFESQPGLKFWAGKGTIDANTLKSMISTPLTSAAMGQAWKT
jgi:maltoporin